MLRARSPRDKIKWLVKATRHIVGSIHAYNDLQERNGTEPCRATEDKIGMSMEDKFLILIWVLVQVNQGLWSHFHFIRTYLMDLTERAEDFIRPEGERSEYLNNIRELSRAITYIQLLDFKLTDERAIFVPFKIIELSVKATLKDGLSSSF